MNSDTMTIVLDEEQAKKLIADCLAPGAVLMPATTVDALCEEYGIKIRDLVRLGGIVAEDEVMQ